MEAGRTLAATLCYICAGNIDKTVEIWSKNVSTKQEGKTYVGLLQVIMQPLYVPLNICYTRGLTVFDYIDRI